MAAFYRWTEFLLARNYRTVLPPGDIEGRVGDADQGPDGSIVMVVTIDVPLRAEGLRRVARRGMLGLARTGGTSSHGSGDYVIAFLTARAVRSWHRSQTDTERGHVLRMDRLSPIFEATIEATEEAIYIAAPGSLS